jgi:hypothetical protein
MLDADECEKTASSDGTAACAVSRAVALTWHPGPARGGEGTAGIRDGVPWWWDSELLLVVVETRGGPSVSMVQVHADGDELGFYDPETGDGLWGYSAEDISWWARIKEALPQNTQGQATP